MLRQSDLTDLLNDFIEYHVPAMLQHQYHLELVKGGPKYPHLSEQSHFVHIINGVLGLIQLLSYLAQQKISIPGLTIIVVRQAIAAFIVHEVHKDTGVEKLDHTEFSIPLEALREAYNRLGLNKFAEVDDHLLRAANVHQRSPRHGDMLLGDSSSQLFWLLVRIADTMASATHPQDAYSTLRQYLQRLSPIFAAKSPPARHALYFHELKEVRGVLTNALHQAVAEQLQRTYRFFPLLYFARGTVYLGPAEIDRVEREPFIEGIVQRTLSAFSDTGRRASAIKESGIRHEKYDFQKFVHIMGDIVDPNVKTTNEPN